MITYFVNQEPVGKQAGELSDHLGWQDSPTIQEAYTAIMKLSNLVIVLDAKLTELIEERNGR